MKNNQAFTLIEIFVVVIISGVMASLAIVKYNRVIALAHERAAIMDLQVIRAALNIHKAKKGSYPLGTDMDNVNEINAVLNLKLVEDKFTYSCQNESGTTGYNCRVISNQYNWSLHTHCIDNGGSWWSSGCPHCWNATICPSAPSGQCS